MPKLMPVRAFSVTYIPQGVLRRAVGADISVLANRMKRHHVTIPTLAARTGIEAKKIQNLVFGEVSPINEKGLWTNTALKVARALKTEPEVIFSDAQDRIGAALAMPDAEMFPESMAGELFDRDSLLR